MDKTELMIIAIFVGSIAGLIATGDNEPTIAVIERNSNSLHYVDTVPPERSTHNVTIITNPNIRFDGCNPDTGMSYEQYSRFSDGPGSGSGGCR